MAITSDDIAHLAELSALDLSENEAVGLQKDIENILGYIEQLKDVDTSEVSPTYQVTGLDNQWRDDAVTREAVTTQDLLALAPEQHNNQVKVPKVL